VFPIRSTDGECLSCRTPPAQLGFIVAHRLRFLAIRRLGLTRGRRFGTPLQVSEGRDYHEDEGHPTEDRKAYQDDPLQFAVAVLRWGSMTIGMALVSAPSVSQSHVSANSSERSMPCRPSLRAESAAGSTDRPLLQHGTAGYRPRRPRAAAVTSTRGVDGWLFSFWLLTARGGLKLRKLLGELFVLLDPLQ
jgi:hypothetical protein